MALPYTQTDVRTLLSDLTLNLVKNHTLSAYITLLEIERLRATFDLLYDEIEELSWDTDGQEKTERNRFLVARR